MKRSKLYLGITVCLLTIAGVGTAKRFDTTKWRYYCTLGDGQFSTCRAAGIFTYHNSGNFLDPIATITFFKYPLWHSVILYTQGIDGFFCDGSFACGNPLHYDDAN